MTNDNTNTKNQTIEDFCNELASKKPTPGGGSVSAMQGALGCGLIAMVADLTVGKEKYAEYEELNLSVLEKSRANKEIFLQLIDDDINAYSKMKDVMALPNDTEQHKQERTNKMQETLKECAIPPFKILKTATESIELIEQIFEKSNVMAQSDLGCAATNLISCMQNAWLNIIANTHYIKDVGFAQKYETDALNLINIYIPRAEKIYNKCK